MQLAVRDVLLVGCGQVRNIGRTVLDHHLFFFFFVNVFNDPGLQQIIPALIGDESRVAFTVQEFSVLDDEQRTIKTTGISREANFVPPLIKSDAQNRVQASGTSLDSVLSGQVLSVSGPAVPITVHKYFCRGSFRRQQRPHRRVQS